VHVVQAMNQWSRVTLQTHHIIILIDNLSISIDIDIDRDRLSQTFGYFKYVITNAHDITSLKLSSL